MTKADDGFLHVADFVTVVRYNKELYPNGIKTYEVKKDEEQEPEVETKPEPVVEE